jgi:hypothetical protein
MLCGTEYYYLKKNEVSIFKAAVAVAVAVDGCSICDVKSSKYCHIEYQGCGDNDDGKEHGIFLSTTTFCILHASHATQHMRTAEKGLTFF